MLDVTYFKRITDLPRNYTFQHRFY